jgi:sec-independent protein translocase protein TatC
MAGKNPGEMTFFDHLDALRPHLVRGVVVLGIAVVAALVVSPWIIDRLLFGPAQPDFVSNRLLTCAARFFGSASGYRAGAFELDIINTRMTGQLSLYMVVAFASALIATLPYLLWELWRFVRPALTDGERRRTRWFVFYVSLCFFTGLLFGYYVIVPLSVNFLMTFQASGAITNLIDVGSFLKTVVSISLGCGLLFQLPILVWFLARMGIVSARWLRKYRRHAIVVLLIFAAVVTPPDVVSQILVSIPLLALYEISIRIAARTYRERT